MTTYASRLDLIAGRDVHGAAELDRLLLIGKRALAAGYNCGGFAFTLRGEAAPGGLWQVQPRGLSVRYGAIAALGLLRFPPLEQRYVLDGYSARSLVDRLIGDLDGLTGRGDAALMCWAAAEAGHSALPRALARLAHLDRQPGPVSLVSAAWVVSALVAARQQADVEEHLASARDRLLASRGPVLFPHMLGGTTAWHSSHVGSFADQAYPVQALARLHASGGDQAALATANSVAAVLARAQGKAGQWWWHYDIRSGQVVEGYPVYSVHQHAMAPMALLDLAEAGGQPYLDQICSGIRWLTRPPECAEKLVLDEPPVIWRKVARPDPRKLVRDMRAASTRLRPRVHLQALDRVFRPGTVDHECRPYELGWLLFAWLPAKGAPGA